MSEQVIWVVLFTDLKSYIGVATKVAFPGKVEQLIFKNQLVDCWAKGAAIFLAPCYLFLDEYIPQQTPQGLALGHQTAALPIGASLDKTSGMWVSPIGLKVIDDEHPNDREAYMNLVKMAESTALSQAAQRAGLTLPGDIIPHNRRT